MARNTHSTERHDMFTYAFVAMLVSMAGPDFTWRGTPRNCDRPSGGIRNGGRVRVGMRLWLHAAQQGLCPTCGHGIPDPMTADVAHVVGSGTDRKGFTPGNIYLSHPSCNVGVARESWERGINVGAGVTDGELLAAIANYCGEEFTRTIANTAGYSLILGPRDFARPDLIAVEWPTDSVGGFIYFDPDFQGKRRI